MLSHTTKVKNVKKSQIIDSTSTLPKALSVSPGTYVTLKKIRAGKPQTLTKRTIDYLRDIQARKVAARWEEIIEAQIDAAIGITTEQHNRQTGELFYTEKGPDVAAAKFLSEGVLGKAEQKIQHSGGLGIVALIKQLDDDGDNNQNQE